MEYEAVVQSALEEIDRRIKGDIYVEDLARAAHYSTHHFRRVFMRVTGTPVVSYITRRKLEHALYELSKGRRILEVAVEYGFETHAGFTRAFKRAFGSPPSLYCLHVLACPPERAAVYSVRLKQEAMNMQVQIKEIQPFDIVGYASRHRLPGVGKISDIPGYWEKINLEYGAALTTLHDTYRQSRHCEVAVCFDLDERQACFTYMLGVGVDGADAAVPQRPGTYRRRIQGGLYAVFTTPRVAEDQYVQSIHDTWGQVLGSWLPQSGYEYDEAREGYEYYDERDHGETAQMDIYVPVRKRGKA